jgi:hypothetical protein
VKIDNKIIDIFHCSGLDNAKSCYILNSIVKIIDFDMFEPNLEIVIENCIIQNLLIHSCWFRKGFIFKNNHVLNYIDYQMGGHNEEPIRLHGNIFHEFVNFFDCQFENTLEIQNNIFVKGSNLLGNNNEGFKNSFDTGIIAKDNIGSINLEGLGR